MGKILIIEDDSSIASVLRVTFKCSGFEVIDVSNGEDGLNYVQNNKPDVVLLDVMLPGIDGFQVCKKLRGKYGNIGIIMLTAKGQDVDKIGGLESGADDYVVKPFNPTELILRVKALMRRASNKVIRDGNIIKSLPFEVDTYSKKVYKNKEELDLTPKEYELMKIFIENPKKAFTREELLKEVWGWKFVGETKNVDVHIRRLRKKVEESSSEPEYIETVWGTGYRWKG